MIARAAMIGRTTSLPDEAGDEGPGDAIGVPAADGEAVGDGVGGVVDWPSHPSVQTGVGSGVGLLGGAWTVKLHVVRSMSPSSADFVVDLIV